MQCKNCKEQRLVLNTMMHRALLLLLVITSVTEAQFKKKQNPYYYNYPQIFLSPDELAERLRQTWLIVQAANNDDASAQLALAARYLTGDGFEADTVKALYWLKRSESLGNRLASYNLALFYYNGWGVEWNPFLGYEYFEKAAKAGIHYAEFALGQLLIENLIVPKNPSLAKEYLQKAAMGGEQGAIEALEDYTRRGYFNDTLQLTQSERKEPENNSPLVFIDFRPDTNRVRPNDTVLIADFYRESGMDTTVKMPPPTLQSAAMKNTEQFEKYLMSAAPEALTLLGRMYETGKGRKKDEVLAASYYIRAVRYDSPRAGFFLNELLNKKQFMSTLLTGVQKNNAECLYVYSALALLNYNKEISLKESYEVLQKAVLTGHKASQIEMGRALFTGVYGEKNSANAFKLWEQSKTREGEILFLCYRTLMQTEPTSSEQLKKITAAAEEGSITALVTLGYCLEKGFGGKQDKAAAERVYRKAASRGSNTGYLALLEIYNTIRPKDTKYFVPEAVTQ